MIKWWRERRKFKEEMSNKEKAIRAKTTFAGYMKYSRLTTAEINMLYYIVCMDSVLGVEMTRHGHGTSFSTYIAVVRKHAMLKIKGETDMTALGAAVAELD